MSQPDKKTLAAEIETKRLEVWREKRAKIAEQSKQERLRAADADRAERVKQQEADKARRALEAADKRAKDEAAKRAERMNAARSRIAGRTDIDAARTRLHKYRTRAMKGLAVRTGLLIGLPTLLAAAYLFAVATPLYEADAKFAVTLPDFPTPTAGAAMPFAATPASQQAHQIRAYIMAPQMLATLNETDGFAAHYAADGVDPLTRDGLNPLQTPTGLDLYNRMVTVSVNGQEGLIDVKVRATTPQQAVAVSNTILSEVGLWLTAQRTELLGAATAKPPLLLIAAPAASEAPLYPRKLSSLATVFLGLTCLYALGAIFLGTLVRHARH